MTSEYLNQPLRDEADARQQAHETLKQQLEASVTEMDLADACFENGALAMKVLAAELLIHHGHRDAARMVLRITPENAKRRNQHEIDKANKS